MDLSQNPKSEGRNPKEGRRRGGNPQAESEQISVGLREQAIEVS